ncbi:hypothetical protein HMPREF1015_02547 [Bacillus smithii 7_3_47FAA]|uniref:Uncharacterized protein n=1 Tax=Bacillus smithii 7_3_47FAA TaxID=665952 RepID=G9QJ99_9BACI|nr:hypothetical protein HMPREF1015_02547 [Bacillus smithii 7_3_47FAA]
MRLWIEKAAKKFEYPLFSWHALNSIGAQTSKLYCHKEPDPLKGSVF